MKWLTWLPVFALLLIPSVCIVSPITYGGGNGTWVYLDIHPTSWPNPINIKAKGMYPAAICGTETFDVSTIDPSTLKIYLFDGTGGVSPERWAYEDVVTPYTGPRPGGHTLGPDGYMDLVFHFKLQDVVTGLNLAAHVGETVTLYIRGYLFNGVPIYGEDYARILDLPGDVNNDARVDILDGTIIGLAWNATPNPSPNWDERADIVEDHHVDILDAVVVSLNWGQTVPLE
jgi:hypothetical protein